MTRTAVVARMALDDARRGRAVLIVTRTAYDASKVMLALENALQRRDGYPKMMYGQGLWHASSSAWGFGGIAVRVQGRGVRGLTADTLLCARDVKRSAWRDARPCTATSSAPIEALW